MQSQGTLHSSLYLDIEVANVDAFQVSFLNLFLLSTKISKCVLG